MGFEFANRMERHTAGTQVWTSLSLHVHVCVQVMILQRILYDHISNFLVIINPIHNHIHKVYCVCVWEFIMCTLVVKTLLCFLPSGPNCLPGCGTKGMCEWANSVILPVVKDCVCVCVSLALKQCHSSLWTLPPNHTAWRLQLHLGVCRCVLWQWCVLAATQTGWEDKKKLERKMGGAE